MNVTSLSEAIRYLDKAKDKLNYLKEKATYKDSEIIRSEFTNLNIRLCTNLTRVSYLGYDYESLKRSEIREDCINRLKTAISDISGFSETELRSYTGNKKEYVEPKQVHIALLSKVFGVSLRLATEIYSRHHSSGTHGNKEVRNHYQTDSDYIERYEPAFKIAREYDTKKTLRFLNKK